MPSIVFSAGDPSGDAHAARLIRALSLRPGQWSFAGLGGPAMAAAGMTLIENLTAAAAIGPFDAARHLSTLTRAKDRLAAHADAHRPDLAVLVDFGDYHLPAIAPLLKRRGIPVAYYISPQLWAWGRWRLRYVKQYVDRMIVLFRFEEEFYRKAGVPVTWAGHPLMEEAAPSRPVEDTAAMLGLNRHRRIVGLLPGSRAQEVRRHLPLMLAASRRIAEQMPGIQVLLPAAPGIDARPLRDALAASGLEGRVAEQPAREVLPVMDAAIVASGTATLETALAGVPMTVIYRTSWPTFLAARAVLRIPDIALVNVVAGRRIVPELLQHEATPARIAAEMLPLLRDQERVAGVKAELSTVKEKLGPPGAVERAADAIVELLKG